MTKSERSVSTHVTRLLIAEGVYKLVRLDQILEVSVGGVLLLDSHFCEMNTGRDDGCKSELV